jgi:hypothetical protein
MIFGKTTNLSHLLVLFIFKYYDFLYYFSLSRSWSRNLIPALAPAKSFVSLRLRLKLRKAVYFGHLLIK